VWELRPGDLIFTGTPEGVGPVASRDQLDGTIEGLIELRVRVD
jgi:fumarylpyruvate hydrolase